MPDPQHLLALAERVERATADSAELMREAATLLLGKVPWCINRMLTVEAYESASMMMVPSDAFWSITMRGEHRGGFHACCQREGALDWREAATPSLALVAAALRATAAQSGGEG
jgi:hypothetical protein